ncbi:hypothetical protein FHR83_007122 [Actinoplanes campanulatus]|uniref:Uncharacterized protein n=1 Tax=Actinoplanes campanulatus TaxID=113559 RepID=A0A7W5FI82_9ACTN|nr:hypothetical protein [Actinoplanes campanulatus]MBB3099416.1 hypothetical protein [Actinoplanes campanulatus]GGN40089.1 hypothetical protein GCM10010109_68700 [Actinoplanes campanulatus]GID42375.1 hypothetical protein Aca09nite_88810 [Actinoplanes campanulatus]
MLNLYSPSDISQGLDDGPSIPRDQWGRPLVVPKQGGSPVPLVRTTTLVDVIDDKSKIIDYNKRMVLLGGAFMANEAGYVRSLDPEDPADKRILNDLAKRAESLAGANVKRDKGSHLHALSEYVDRGEELPTCSDQDRIDMAAYKAATAMLKVRHIERFVVMPELQAGGTPDRVSTYDGLAPDGELAGDLITDLKTGNIEYGKLKMAAQLAGYANGEFYDWSLFPVDAADKKAFAAWKKQGWLPEESAQAYSPIGVVNPRWGLIMNLRPGTGLCTLHWIDLAKGWRAAQAARHLYDLRRDQRVFVPFVKP